MQQSSFGCSLLIPHTNELSIGAWCHNHTFLFLCCVRGYLKTIIYFDVCVFQHVQRKMTIKGL